VNHTATPPLSQPVNEREIPAEAGFFVEGKPCPVLCSCKNCPADGTDMKTQNRYALILSLLLLLPCLNASAQTGHNVGDTAPEFKLKTLAGKTTTLADLRAKGHVLLVFWAAECVYCFAHIKDFNALHDQYNGKGLTVAAINIGGEYEKEISDYTKENNLRYLVLANRLDNLDVAEAYRAVGTPTLVMVSPAGKILFRGHQPPDVTQWLK